jgi:hypothetical protein
LGDHIENNETGGVCSTYGAKRGVCRILVGIFQGKNPLGMLGRDRIILKWIFKKWYMGVWTGSSWPMIGTGGGHLSML